MCIRDSYLLSSASTLLQGVVAAKLTRSTVLKLRGDLFARIERLPLRYIDTHKLGDIMSRMTNDVENISNTVSSSIASLFSGVLTLIGTVAIMLWYSPVMTLVAMITGPLTLLCGTKIGGTMRTLFSKQQAILGRLNGHVEEMVTGHKTVVAFGHEQRAIREFAEISEEMKKTSIRAQIFGGTMGPVKMCIRDRLDRMLENGMAVSIGRLREDSQYTIKFVCLSHNTLRGAAGGAVLMAELLCAKGFVRKSGENV